MKNIFFVESFIMKNILFGWILKKNLVYSSLVNTYDFFGITFTIYGILGYVELSLYLCISFWILVGIVYNPSLDSLFMGRPAL